MLKKTLRNQKGFTLIEIIAVLVILGILAAVAVPKFIGLQEDAKNAAGKAALGAAAANVQSAYSKLLVAGTAGTTNTALLTALASTTSKYTEVGDFTVTYTAGSTGTADVMVTLTAPGSTAYGSTYTTKNVPVFPIP
jgi:prepilin-type N-terminal cleavage/methylation domain-containing protein